LKITALIVSLFAAGDNIALQLLWKSTAQLSQEKRQRRIRPKHCRGIFAALAS